MSHRTTARRLDRRSVLTGAARLAGVLTLLPAEAFDQSPRKGFELATLGLERPIHIATQAALPCSNVMSKRSPRLQRMAASNRFLHKPLR